MQETSFIFVFCNFTKFTVSSRSFLVGSLESSMYSVILSLNSNSLISSFPIQIPFISSSLTSMARTSKTMLDNMWTSLPSSVSMFLILEGMLSAFHC